MQHCFFFEWSFFRSSWCFCVKRALLSDFLLFLFHMLSLLLLWQFLMVIFLLLVLFPKSQAMFFKVSGENWCWCPLVVVWKVELFLLFFFKIWWFSSQFYLAPSSCSLSRSWGRTPGTGQRRRTIWIRKLLLLLYHFLREMVQFTEL